MKAQGLETSSRHWPWWEWALLLLIIGFAAALRFWRLDSVPPGLTHDEAAHGQDAIAILHGARPLYETVGYGREPLYDYVVAAAMALSQNTGYLALRAVSATFGILTIVASYLWIRRAFGRWEALLTCAWLAGSFWALSVSRQALRSTMLPALLAAAAYAWWRGTFGSSERARVPWSWFAFSGLCISATLWTYMAARLTWVLFLILPALLALVDRSRFRQRWPGMLLALVLAGALSAPMFVWLWQHPGAEQRLAMLDEPLQALKAGDLSVPLDRAWSYVSGLFIPGAGDRFLAYNIPGRPTFDPLTSILFAMGLILGLARWRRPAYAFALLWFLVGVTSSLITGATASFTRSVAVLPVAFLFPALAVVAGVRWAAARWGRWALWIASAGVVVAVIAIGAVAAHAYFVLWGESPEVRAAYLHPLVEIAEYLDDVPGDGSVGLSAYLPHAPHDPYVFEMSLQRRDLSLRWFDARRAIVLPQAAGVLLIVPAGVGPDPYFADLPGLQLRERVVLREDDADPYVDVYDWEPPLALAALRERMRGESADLGALHMIGHDLRTSAVAPGGVVELVTFWQVIDPEPLRPQNLSDAEQDLVLFTHALDEAGSIVGQEDRLDAPAWDWQAGDTIAQIHRFSLRDDLSDESVALEIGVYRRSDGVRLPVWVDGDIVGDSVILQSLEIIVE